LEFESSFRRRLNIVEGGMTKTRNDLKLTKTDFTVLYKLESMYAHPPALLAPRDHPSHQSYPQCPHKLSGCMTSRKYIFIQVPSNSDPHLVTLACQPHLLEKSDVYKATIYKIQLGVRQQDHRIRNASNMDKENRMKHIAVVGSGSSALGALWALGHSKHQVYLYEADKRLGGHANAVCFRNERNGKSCMVDTAFMMVNDTTYREMSNPRSYLYERAEDNSQLYRRFG
jgi:hypothetical protein